MKKWLILGVFFSMTLAGNSQNSFYFSHYMLNPLYYNPAWSGVERTGYVAVQYRNQWTGYASSFDGRGGAPNTQLLSLSIPVNSAISGIGLNVSNDVLGPLSFQQVQVAGTWGIETNFGKFHFGVMPGLLWQSLDFNQLRPNDPADPILEGMGGKQTDMRYDLAAGMYYYSDEGFYVGVGASNLLQPSFGFGIDSLDNQLSISYTANGGFSWNLSDDLLILPSILVRSDLKGFTFDLSGMVVYQSRMWGGLSYRMSESAVLFLGYSLLKNNVLKLGYAFDYVIKAQAAKQVTSNEIFLRFDLPDLVFGGKRIVKTPRFSF